MKRNHVNRLLFISISLVVSLFSCTVDKRLYSSGYYIQPKNDKVKLENAKPADQAALNKEKITKKNDEADIVVIKSATGFHLNNNAMVSVESEHTVTEVCKPLCKKAEYLLREDRVPFPVLENKVGSALIPNGIISKVKTNKPLTVSTRTAGGNKNWTIVYFCDKKLPF